MVLSPDHLPAVLPDSWLLRLEAFEHRLDGITLTLSVTSDAALCPVCGTPSTRIHSRYTRTLRDIPWQQNRVRLCIHSRRFFCVRDDCCRRIFAERLPDVSQSYSRQTYRLTESLRAIGFALGGEAGLRLAQLLGFECSADMLLRAIMSVSASTEPETNLRAVGIDDWAWRKRQRYGTIVVDLETRRPVDVLPDRSSETVETWLRKHPTIQVVSRDRAGAYAQAATNGAPQAIQVADRWHLLCNLTQTIQRILERLCNALRQTRPAELTSQQPNGDGPEQKTMPKTQHEKLSEQRRQRRLDRYDAVVAAYQRGSSQRAIAREMKMSLKTVRRFLSSTEFPEQVQRRRRSQILQFQPYLEQRWSEGCHNASQLCREIRKQGYTGKMSILREFLHAWRKGNGPPPRKRLPSPRVLAFWLARPTTERTPEQESWAAAVTAACPEVAIAESLAHQFREQLIVTRSATGLADWLRRAAETNIAEFRGFVLSIERDYNAVAAAFEQPWSNGPVEAHIHRLKAIKRQMYGRAGFRLLRCRVLSPSSKCFTAQPHAP